MILLARTIPLVAFALVLMGGGRFAHHALEHGAAPAERGDHAHACAARDSGQAPKHDHEHPPVPAPRDEHPECDLCLHLGSITTDTLWMTPAPMPIPIEHGWVCPTSGHIASIIGHHDSSPRAPPVRRPA